MLLCALAGLARSTWALADPAEVEDLIRQGVEFRRQGKDAQALPLFRKAHDLASTPRTAAQVGLSEMALGYQLDAERHLLESLAVPKDLWIRRNKERLERALQTVRASIGEIAVDGSPTAADVFVNATLVGKIPLPGPVRVGEGRSVVKVVAAGFVAETVSVTVAAGRREDVHVRLQRDQIARPPAAEPVAAQHVQSLAEASTPAREPRTDSADSDAAPAQNDAGENAVNRLRVAAWATGAAAVAAVGFGAFETWRWQNKLDAFNGVLTSPPNDPAHKVSACGTADPNRGVLPVCGDLYGQFDRARTLAIVGYVAGGALAIGSAILFVVSGNDDESKSPHALACGPSGLGARGVSCVVSF
jgi:hypothetical protein